MPTFSAQAELSMHKSSIEAEQLCYCVHTDNTASWPPDLQPTSQDTAWIWLEETFVNVNLPCAAQRLSSSDTQPLSWSSLAYQPFYYRVAS